MPRLPSAGLAPPWAVPLLAAILVATSRRHALRHLDEHAFRRTARGCDHFIAWTTLPGFTAAATLLPRAIGAYLLLGFSLWGLIALFAVGRKVSLERKRRSALPR